MSVSTAKLSLEVSDVQSDEDCDELVSPGTESKFHVNKQLSILQCVVTKTRITLI